MSSMHQDVFAHEQNFHFSTRCVRTGFTIFIFREINTTPLFFLEMEIISEILIHFGEEI